MADAHQNNGSHFLTVRLLALHKCQSSLSQTVSHV